MYFRTGRVRDQGAVSPDVDRPDSPAARSPGEKMAPVAAVRVFFLAWKHDAVSHAEAF